MLQMSFAEKKLIKISPLLSKLQLGKFGGFLLRHSVLGLLQTIISTKGRLHEVYAPTPQGGDIMD